MSGIDSLKPVVCLHLLRTADHWALLFLALVFGCSVLVVYYARLAWSRCTVSSSLLRAGSVCMPMCRCFIYIPGLLSENTIEEVYSIPSRH